MLRDSDDSPTLQALMSDAEAFVSHYVLPRTDVEEEYLLRFAAGDYRPDLLFADETVSIAALQNPEALWKLQNLRKMQNM